MCSTKEYKKSKIKEIVQVIIINEERFRNLSWKVLLKRSNIAIIFVYYFLDVILHKEGKPMFIAILFLLVAVLCAIAVVREVRNKNLLAIAFSGISVLVFGWFGIMTLINSGWPTG